MTVTELEEIRTVRELRRAFTKGVMDLVCTLSDADLDREVAKKVKENVLEYLQGDTYSTYLKAINLPENARLLDVWTKLESHSFRVGLIFRVDKNLYMIGEDGSIVSEVPTKTKNVDWSEEDQKKLRDLWVDVRVIRLNM